MAIQSFRDLVVWQKAMELAELTYKISNRLPNSEVYGLGSQMQRSAVSIPSNISEGCQRNNRQEFKQFCGIAYGSAAKLETQLILANRLYNVKVEAELALLNEVQKMLRVLISKLTTKN
ncbi:MAG TPA: four helix bundle protein [Candidatus Saccharimonadales bacterium]|nr:four helix bundle protein [Candidatus Saccharimonadales bacterium]